MVAALVADRLLLLCPGDGVAIGGDKSDEDDDADGRNERESDDDDEEAPV